jgi:hypothetical protein
LCKHPLRGKVVEKCFKLVNLTEKQIKDIENEINIMMKVKEHPNIVRIF